MATRRETLAGLGIREITLVSYDIRAANGRAKVALNRFLFGRKERRNGRMYPYPGLVTEGARRVGQSVFLLEPDLADRLIAKLQELRVWYSTIDLLTD